AAPVFTYGRRFGVLDTLRISAITGARVQPSCGRPLPAPPVGGDGDPPGVGSDCGFGAVWTHGGGGSGGAAHGGRSPLGPGNAGLSGGGGEPRFGWDGGAAKS